MKKEILIKIIRKIKSSPDLKRKVKIFAIVGLVGFLLTATLTIWAGISAFNYVMTKANEVGQSPAAIAGVENIKSELKGVTNVQLLSCWQRALSLLDVQPWLARPAIENLAHLKVACLGAKPPACEGPECNKEDSWDNTTEGVKI